MRSWWLLCKSLTRIFAAPTWKLRPTGAANLPASGGVLLAANHQSFLDPLLLASCLPRELHFMARSTLFEIPVFRSLIVACNAFPIERDSRDVKGVKSAIERLRAGKVLVVFPEGTRTRDGRFGPLKKGVRMLAERAAVPVIPVLIDGAHRVWPRSRAWPGLFGRIDVALGRPFDVGEVPDVEGRVRSDWIGMKRRLGRPVGDDGGAMEIVSNVEPQAGA